MKVVFFTENNFTGQVPRHLSGRTDTSWMSALNAHHFPFGFYDEQFQPDICIFIIPKKDANRCISSALAIRARMRNQGSKCLFASMQEGPHQLFQDWDIYQQFAYINFLKELDIVFCHNEYDRKYYAGIFPDKNIFVLSSLMVEDAIPVDKLHYGERNGVMIGGNMVSWYGGFDSFLVARELDEKIYAPSMGRKQIDEENNSEVNYLPYLDWPSWLVELSKRKYAVHLMRTFAAGTFALNCARLGVPCIGFGSNREKEEQGCDTQRILFPELTVPIGDMVTAKKKAIWLKENKQFYDHVVSFAFNEYHRNYREEVFLQKFRESVTSFKAITD
jgi:hypothetical protein